jgi:beta-lactam-binding protein with PASTA domain
VVGQKVDAAKKLLEQKGFKNIKTEEVHDEEEAGTIIEQDPAAGTEIVAADDEVKLTVSLGPEDITLRDLKTYSKQAASGYLDDHGLSLSKKKRILMMCRKVRSCQTKAGAGTASVKPGDEVEVTFSLGPKKTRKTVTEKIDIPYEPENEGRRASSPNFD